MSGAWIPASPPWQLSTRRRPAAALAVIAVAGMLAAGCGAATNSLHPGRETIKTASKPPLGPVLVDDDGQTVYLFARDEKNESYCYGACASVWPPVTTASMPHAAGQAQAGKLNTFQRRDGRTQVAYNGHPLYYYQADTDPDDAYGQDIEQFGAEWYAVTPAGSNAEEKGEGGGS